MAMSGSYETLREEDVVNYMAKEVRPSGEIFGMFLDLFNEVAATVEMPKEQRNKFLKVFLKAESKLSDEVIAKDMYDALHEFIINSLWHGQSVDLRGFVQFNLVDVPEHIARNVSKNEEMIVPARQKVRLKMLAELKKITSEIDDNGVTVRHGDHPAVELRRQRELDKEERRRLRARRERSVQDAKDAQKLVEQMERELAKAVEAAEKARQRAELLEEAS